jgi:hypothetical protein
MNSNFNNAFRRLRWWALAGMALALYTCVDPYSPDIQTGPIKLIVDGLLTDGPGPYTVTLALSEPYNNERGTLPVNSAQVYVEDHTGQRFDYTPRGSGIYQSDSAGFRGQAGFTYTLFVRASDGSLYRSRPELLRAAPAIDTAYTEYYSSTNSAGIRVAGFEVYIETADPDTSGNFYSWNWTHYDTIDYCLQRLDGETRVMYLSPCCDPCWTVKRCNGCINVLSDVFVNGNTLKRQIATIPYNSKSDYFMVIDQLALSREAYQFWQLVNGQINNSGGIFDQPPATVPGNMYLPEKPEEQVLGFFAAAGLARKSVFLKRNYVADPPITTTTGNLITSQTQFCEPCVESRTRTARRPPGW